MPERCRLPVPRRFLIERAENRIVRLGRRYLAILITLGGKPYQKVSIKRFENTFSDAASGLYPMANLGNHIGS